MIYQDCYNKYYTINYFNYHIEIEINFIPKDDFNKAKINFGLIVYYSIDNTVIKYKNKFFHNEQELKHFFKTEQNIHLNTSKYKNIKLSQ